jgi:hypothetical protein
VVHESATWFWAGCFTENLQQKSKFMKEVICSRILENDCSKTPVSSVACKWHGSTLLNSKAERVLARDRILDPEEGDSWRATPRIPARKDRSMIPTRYLRATAVFGDYFRIADHSSPQNDLGSE